MPFFCVRKDDLSGLSLRGSWIRYKNPVVITDGFTSGTNRNHCTSQGWITRDTFLPHMQRSTLKVRMSSGKVLSDSAQVLPCALEELRYETTSLDPYANKCVCPDNILMPVLWTEDVNQVKKGTRFYNKSGSDLTTKFVFKVKNYPQKNRAKPADINLTKTSLYGAIFSGSFGLRSRRNLGKERNGATQISQYLPTTEKNRIAQLYAYDPQDTSRKTSD